MTATRLKSSFIYLANAVNDLRGNWMTLALVLAPLVIAASLCLLPEAINLHEWLVSETDPNVRNIAAQLAQLPHTPGAAEAPPAESALPIWLIRAFQALAVVIALSVNLVALCTFDRAHRGVQVPGAAAETLQIYRRALALFPSFLWIIILQVLVVVVAFMLPRLLAPATNILTFVGLIVLFVPAVMANVWLYFAQYALVFEDKRSWHALLHSRELTRGVFIKAAVRIVVFLAVWSGYNSWAYVTGLVLVIVLAPVGVLTGFVWTVIFLLEILAVSVTFATTAFFMAAGVRLYEDLRVIAGENESRPRSPGVDAPTAALSGAT
ncbi:MAG: hypothetical protein ACREQF_10735 [Candidatus Binataceae bacterium]